MDVNMNKKMGRYKIGEVVKLNSGGPAMTVSGYAEGLEKKGNFVEVTWFDEGRVEHSIFLEEMLSICAEL